MTADVSHMNSSLGTDQDQILGHIHSIFRAYLDRDRKVLRETHTHDWRGFTVGAEVLIRGIDGYMDRVEQFFSTSRTVGYELLDTDISVRGDIAVVYYLARYSFRNDAGDHTIHLRSVDIYEKRSGRWIQSGSNICSLPLSVAEAATRVPDVPESQAVAKPGR